MNDVRAAIDVGQARASNPLGSAWVSANAGSGKTHVLVERILRLLLTGVEPRKILCLTYTKAAAAEMANRVFARLSRWATATDGALRADLNALMRSDPTADHIVSARRMFAATLDAPGLMRIHTIHGFCERLLQRFPLEAGAPPAFSVLDEAEADALVAAAFDRALADATRGGTDRLASALRQLLVTVNELGLRDLTKWAVARRDDIRAITRLHQGGDAASAERGALLILFGVPEGATEAQLVSDTANVLTAAEMEAAAAALASSAGNDLKALKRLNPVIAARSEDLRVNALGEFFLTRGDLRKSICSDKIDPAIKTVLTQAAEEFQALRIQLLGLQAAESSAAMLVFADAVIARYEQAKTRETVLDFTDLIERTRSLLLRADAASWVLYKLDGGIDHILVDEAQDTSGAQWGIVGALAAEFFAGEGVERGLRTLFAVGDEKQSIFSFQGAAPDRFAETGTELRRRAQVAGIKMSPVVLNLSFRSTSAVLGSVDGVFAQADARKGLTFGGTDYAPHAALREGHAGLVELWQVEEIIPASPSPAFKPLDDESDPASASGTLAERIARRIAHMMTTGEVLESAGRPIEPRDILILVRSRGTFAPAMVNALKTRGIPVAGADRMVLAEHLAVQDLVALGAFLLLPEDDLSLACVLKSPLIGLDDDDLFAIGHGRSFSLWSALRDRADSDPRFFAATTQLNAWLGRVDLVPPYEFYATLLGANDQEMRQRLLAAMGPGAADAIDEFLEIALRHDERGSPSMQAFLAAFAEGTTTVKRDMDQGRNEVRVMTVHGAKGLEANIVFLPDTCGLPIARSSQLLPTHRQGAPGAPHLVHDFPGSQMVPQIQLARAARREDDMAEYRRLLYVGMTRARDRLYVCGWKGRNSYPATTWQALIRGGLSGSFAPAECPIAGQVLRLVEPQTVPCATGQAGSNMIQRAIRPPEWAFTPAPQERRPRIATPSSLDTGWDLARDAKLPEPPPLGPASLAHDARFERGRIAHLLLQHLPEHAPEKWDAMATELARLRAHSLDDAARDSIVAETLAILRDPQFAPLFGPGSRAEVGFVARIGSGVEIAGQIDRLVDLGDRMLIVDYKTNRPPPLQPEDVAPAYLAQLAAYRASLRLAFPGKRIDAALVWTDGPRLMPIPDSLLDKAEARIDAAGPQP